MKNYDIVSVLWMDHVGFSNAPMIHRPKDELDKLTLTVGVLYKETDECQVIVSDIERHSDVDLCNYVLILKSAIVATQKYGEISLRKLKA